MHEMVSDYWRDLGPYLQFDFPEWFDFVRKIPYISDEERFSGRVVEIVSRPSYLLDRSIFPRIDCKKKAILVGAWARGNRTPYRFIAVSHKPDRKVHHVFPQVDLGNGWINADATFPEFQIGDPQPATFAAELIK